MKELYTTKEVMQILKVSRSTLNRFKVRGMPCIRINPTTVRYDMDEVMKWIKENKT